MFPAKKEAENVHSSACKLSFGAMWIVGGPYIKTVAVSDWLQSANPEFIVCFKKLFM